MPRRPDQERRNELARAAFDILLARGTQTSMRELADALGVKRPTLYFYFPDLNAVFETVIEQTYQVLAQLVATRIRDLDHPLDRLFAIVDTILAFHAERPQLIGGLLQLWAVGGRDVTSVLTRERRVLVATRDALVADLRAGIARKDVLPCDPERVVDLVLAVVDGVLVQHVLGIARPEDVIAELTARVIEPLRPPKRKKAR